MSIIIRLQNLPWDANALNIRQFFYGLAIPDGGVHIIGGDKGDAFIAFSSDEDARMAMRKDGLYINNNPIKLYLSSKTEMQNIIAAARNGPSSTTPVKDPVPFERSPQPPATGMFSNFGMAPNKGDVGTPPGPWFDSKMPPQNINMKPPMNDQRQLGGGFGNSPAGLRGQMDRSFDNAGFKPTVPGEAGRMFGGQADGFPGNNGGRPLHNDPPGLQGGPWGLPRDAQPRRGDDFVDPFGNRPPIDTPRNDMPGRNFGGPDIRPEFGGKGRDGDWSRPGFKPDAARDFDRIDDVRDFRRPGDERRDFGRPDDRRDFPRPSDNMNRDFNRPEHEREFRLGVDRGMIGGPDRGVMGGPDRGVMGGPDRGLMGGPDRGMMGGPDRGMMGGPDRGMMGGPDRGMMGGADRMFPGNELNDDFQRQKEPFGRERRMDPMENNLLRGRDFPEPGGFRDQRPQFDPIPSNPVAKFGAPGNNFPGEFGQQPLMQMSDRWHGDASADRFDPARRNMSPPRDARPPFPGFGGPHPEDDWQGRREQRPGFNGPAQRSLCVRVRNLPLLYNYREVRRFFRGCEIPNDGLKIINDRSGNRTGICFVRFGQPQHFVNALTHDGKVIDNCKISVVKCSNQEYDEAVDGYKPPRDRSRSPMHGRRSPERGQRHELYIVIKKLPTNFEKVDVKKFLGNAHIAEGGGPFIEIGRDGRRTGNALVELERKKDLDEAVSLHMSKYQGCIINVFAISKREYEERIVKAKSDRGESTTERGDNKQNKPEVRSKDEPKTKDGEKSTSIPADDKQTSTKKYLCVEVSGLSWNATVDTVKEFFKGADIAPNGIHLVLNREGKAAGNAFVEFATSADCTKGVARNREFIGKRYIEVKPVTKTYLLDEFKRQQRLHGGNTDSPSSGGGFGKQEDVTVFMKNLNYRTQLEDILEFFQGFRPIADSIKLQYKDNRPTGDGLVVFRSRREADSAIKQLNRKPLLGKPIELGIWSKN